MDNSHNYKLWYIANGSPSAENAHQLIADTKNNIALDYASQIRFNNRQLAEGILNAVKFDTQARSKFQIETKDGNKLTANKVGSRQRDHIHANKGQLIRSAWEKPTPSAEEVAEELAERYILPRVERDLEELKQQAYGIMSFKIGNKTK